jgi:hypothetical protein
VHVVILSCIDAFVLITHFVVVCVVVHHTFSQLTLCFILLHVSGKEAFSSWEDVAEGRNFGTNDAMSSSYTLNDFPEVSSQEVLDSAALNRGSGGTSMFSTFFITLFNLQSPASHAGAASSAV